MTELKYRHADDMGEISGFGGGYERACQRMLNAGILWLEEHPNADPQFHGYPGVVGLIGEDNDDARALSKAVMEVAPDCSGAMHEAVIHRVLYVKAHGWDSYVRLCSERQAERQAESS